MNIKFNYLYRDAGNYKNYGCVIFSNPNQLELGYIESRIKESLIDRSYFVAKDVSVPELYFAALNEDDHGWHEYCGIENTLEETTDGLRRGIDELIGMLEGCAKSTNLVTRNI
jgi:hypothetical protein